MNKDLGQNWILLRGLARESEHWGAFVPLLQSTFPEAKITTLDLPGTGCFYQDTSPNTIKEITSQLRQHAFDIGFIQQPITILALSLGAMVAWEWMRRYPEDISAGILINTSFADLSPFYHRLRWQNYKKLLGLIMASNIHTREARILQLVSNCSDGNNKMGQAWEKIQNARPISFKNCWRQIKAAATYRPGNIKPIQSVFLLNSLGDRLVAPICSEAISKKWSFEIQLHPWAGHDLPLDDSDWVVSQLKIWVNKTRINESLLE